LSARLEEGGKRAAEPGGRAPHSEEREEEGAGKEQSATPSLAPDTSPCVGADNMFREREGGKEGEREREREREREGGRGIHTHTHTHTQTYT